MKKWPHAWFRLRYCARAVVVLLGGLAVTSAWAQGTTVTITAADCAALTEHVPAPGVEYQPGVDVEGNKVAPADLAATPALKLPDEVHIPITVDLAARYGIPATSNLFKSEAYIGSARVRLRDGSVWFNGQPLTSEESQLLSRLCAKSGQ